MSATVRTSVDVCIYRVEDDNGSDLEFTADVDVDGDITIEVEAISLETHNEEVEELQQKISELESEITDHKDEISDLELRLSNQDSD